MGDYTHLSMRDRCKLTTLIDMGLGISEIAKRLGRHRSTIYRELSRNHTQGHYRPGLAHAQAHKRRPRKRLKLSMNKRLYHYVYDRLTQGWSPEQIVGRMRLEKQKFDSCPETIYRYVYEHGQQYLWRYLPTKRKKRRKRCARRRVSCRYGERRLITKRPESIEKRDRMGHWEGDLIAFSGTRKKSVTTLVERKSRFVTLLKNTSKRSRVVMNAIAHRFSNQSSLTCRTITFDQGIEFADYPRLEKVLRCKVYYCQIHSPWQKGSNENMNGRLRRYLPRHTDLNQINQKEL